MKIQNPLYHIEGHGRAPGSSDEILIEILESGDIKITTDPVSGPNHMSAEGLLRTIGEIAGGLVARVRRRFTHTQHKQHVEQHNK
jgi:hypothetical protein